MCRRPTLIVSALPFCSHTSSMAALSTSRGAPSSLGLWKPGTMTIENIYVLVCARGKREAWGHL